MTTIAQPPLVLNLLNAVGEKLSEQLLVKLPVLTMANNPIQQFLNRGQGREDAPVVQYPLFWIKPRSFQPNHQSPYSPSRMAKSPLTEILAPTVNGQYVSTRLIPSLITVEVGYLSNDSQDLIMFASNWAALYRSGKFDFNLPYIGINLSIYVELQENAEVPELDMGEEINQAVIQTSLTVHGYVELPGREASVIPAVASPEVYPQSPPNNTDNPNRYVTYSSYSQPMLVVKDPVITIK